jgi:hypothetical protein
MITWSTKRRLIQTRLLLCLRHNKDLLVDAAHHPLGFHSPFLHWSLIPNTVPNRPLFFHSCGRGLVSLPEQVPHSILRLLAQVCWSRVSIWPSAWSTGCCLCLLQTCSRSRNHAYWTGSEVNFRDYASLRAQNHASYLFKHKHQLLCPLWPHYLQIRPWPSFSGISCDRRLLPATIRRASRCSTTAPAPCRNLRPNRCHPPSLPESHPLDKNLYILSYSLRLV